MTLEELLAASGEAEKEDDIVVSIFMPGFTGRHLPVAGVHVTEGRVEIYVEVQ